MSLAPRSYASLCSSSSPLRLAAHGRPSSVFFLRVRNRNYSTLKDWFLEVDSVTQLEKALNFVDKASEKGSAVDAAAEGEEGEEEKYWEYEVEIEQPYGLKFVTGRDGRTYIDAIAPGRSADKTGKFEVGDKVIASSTFAYLYYSTKNWALAHEDAEEGFSGKVENVGELTEKEIIGAEGNSRIISNRVREIQNAQRKKEQKERREKDLRIGLQLYRGGKYEEALERFEFVLGPKPDTTEASVASYNVACCYSKLNLRMRSDPDPENARNSDEFDPLLKKYDESFSNENAINAIKSLFGFSKK